MATLPSAYDLAKLLQQLSGSTSVGGTILLTCQLRVASVSDAAKRTGCRSRRVKVVHPPSVFFLNALAEEYEQSNEDRRIWVSMLANGVRSDWEKKPPQADGAARLLAITGGPAGVTRPYRRILHLNPALSHVVGSRFLVFREALLARLWRAGLAGGH